VVSAEENTILIKVFQQEKGYKAKKYAKEFSNRILSLLSLSDPLTYVTHSTWRYRLL